jgi:hypothetical protein
MTKAPEVAALKREVAALKKTLGTLISWMASSANSPIRIEEAKKLLEMLDDRRCLNTKRA